MTEPISDLRSRGVTIISSIYGIFTRMTTRDPDPSEPLPEGYVEIVEHQKSLMALADALGWPRQWMLCQHCGEYSWTIPPHAFDPCPLIVEAAETAGLKMDAERTQAIRVGVAIEDQMKALRQWMIDQGLLEEGDDE